MYKKNEMEEEDDNKTIKIYKRFKGVQGSFA